MGLVTTRCYAEGAMVTLGGFLGHYADDVSCV